MATRLEVDLRNFGVAWTTSTSYTVDVNAGLVVEVGNNRSPSPAVIPANTFTTFASGPSVSSVSPALGSTSSFINTATLTYNRIIFDQTATNYYLYKTVGSTATLISTISSTGTRITKISDTVKVDLTDLIEGSSNYHLRADTGAVSDMFNFKSLPITNNSVFQYITTSGPQVISVTPAYGTTGTFVSTATLTFNRAVDLYQNNIYLYNNSGVFRTFVASTSTNLYKTTASTIAVTVYDQPLPEGEYYIGWNLRAIRDNFRLPADAVTNNSVLKWTSVSLSELDSRNYNARIVNDLFETNTPSIIDQDPSTATQYTLSLSSTVGTFTSTVGTLVGSTWTYTATKTELNNAFNTVNFTAPNPLYNPDGTYTFNLSKKGTAIATRARSLVGIPFDLETGRNILISNTLTNSVGAATTLTVTLNTGSVITGAGVGIVTFKANGVSIGTGTVVNNVSTLTLAPNTLSTGTYTIYADWAGGTINPKFNSTISNSISQVLLAKSPVTPSISITPGVFYYHNEDEATLSTIATATVTLSNIYITHRPLGDIKLYDSSTLIAQGTLTPGNTLTNSSASLTWNPSTANQIDQGLKNLIAVYDGDEWNLNAQTNASFTALTKRNPASFFISATTSTLIRPFLTITAQSTSSLFSGKTVKFYTSNNVLFGEQTFIGTQTSGSFVSTEIQPIGNTTIRAEFDETFSYYSTVSNSIQVNVIKGTFPFTISASTATVYKPMSFNVISSSTHNYQGAPITYFANTTTLSSGTYNGNQSQLTIGTSSLSTGTYAISATVNSDNNYNSTSSNTINVNVIDRHNVNLSSSIFPFTRYYMTRVEKTHVALPVTISTPTLGPEFTGTVTISDGNNLSSSTSFISTTTSTVVGFTWSPISKNQVDQGPLTITVNYSGDNYHTGTSTSTTFTAVQKTTLTTSSFSYSNLGTQTSLSVYFGSIDPKLIYGNYYDTYHKPTSIQSQFQQGTTSTYCSIYNDELFPYLTGSIDASKMDVFINGQFIEFGSRLITNGKALTLIQEENRLEVPVYSINDVITLRIFSQTSGIRADQYAWPDGTIKFYNGSVSTSTLIATTTSTFAGYVDGNPNQRPVGVATATVTLSTGTHNIIAVLENDTYFENFTTPAYTVIK
jgi:hypothetical protein